MPTKAQPANPNVSGEVTNRPIDEVRIGRIKGAIWANPTENGVRYNVTFSRLYKEGEEWCDSDSFGRDELLLLAKVADCAHTWICDRQAADRGGSDMS